MSSIPLHFQALTQQLSFDGEVFPKVVVNDGSVTNVTDAVAFIQQHQSQLEQHLGSSGALLFRGFPIDSAAAFDTFSAGFGYPDFTYQESLSNAVRINFTERVFTANEAPQEVEIYLHHEMAQTPISPDKLFFFCAKSAEHGGETPLCRSDKLWAKLREVDFELAAEFASKGLRYTTCMPAANDANSGQGRSWKSTLSVRDTTAAESKLAELGYSWEWLPNGSLKAITPVLPAVVTLDNGVEVFYNQLIAAYLGWPGVREDPSVAITFGDGSHIPPAGLQSLASLAAQFTVDIPWQDGDVALVDNYLTMHGRRPFSGARKRQVLVALAAKSQL